MPTTTTVTISAAEAVSVVWRPATQQVTGTLSAVLRLEVTNLGNASTAYQFYGSANPAAIMLFSLPSLPIPARTTVSLDVVVSVPAEGIYQLTGTASGLTAQDSAFATLTVGKVERVLYLPLIQKE